MKIKFIICTAVFLLLVSCTAQHKSEYSNEEKSKLESIAPSAADATPTHIITKIAAARSLKLEKQADRVFAQLAMTKDEKKALELAGSAIEIYKKAVDLNEGREILVHKYCRAVQVKYDFIIPDSGLLAEKQKIYAETLAMLERLHPGPGENNSSYADYDTALMLILNMHYYIFIQAIVAVNRIYTLSKKIYEKDRGFEDYNIVAALGRLSLNAPNIPFLIPWPDKKASRQYLEEAIKYKPDSLLVKFFLADTLYALNDKERAALYFREVNDALPKAGIDYFQDMKIKRACAERMKELGIK